jgi:hypothetical protein
MEPVNMPQKSSIENFERVPFQKMRIDRLGKVDQGENGEKKTEQGVSGFDSIKKVIRGRFSTMTK